MSSTIIKLRESESSSKSSHADFKITLNNPILLEQGDSLRIKSVFLDTISASGDFIELENDVDIEIDVIKWLINDSVDQTFPSDATRMRSYCPNADADLLSKGDAKIYVACKKAQTTAQTEQVDKIFFDCKPKHSTKMVGGLDLLFSYTEVGGGLGHYSFRVKRQKGTDFIHSYGLEHDTKIFMEGRTLTCLNTVEQLDKHNINKSSITFKYANVKPGTGNDIAILDDRTFKYTLPAGVYSPTQLGEIITDQMTIIDGLNPGVIGNDLNNNVFPVNSAFLTTALQLIAEDATSFFCENSGTQLLKYNESGKMKTDNEDRFIGASQVSLQFDEDHKKMSFSILHTPMFVNESNNENDGTPGVVYDNDRIIDSYSGCAFTRMSPPDFWTNLGFDGVCVSSQMANVITDNGIIGSNVRALEVGIQVGVNRTGGFESLDTPVQKNANFRKPNPTGKISTNATTPIFGNRVFTDDFSNEGYYFIELDCGLKQNLVGSSGHVGFNSTKIHSIVSTYFSQGNFTSDQGTGSVGYVHKGNPVMLSSFNVRVLNSSGNVPSDIEIGSHNSVFVEVIKP